MKPIQAKIAELRGRLAGTPVTATEPIFGYMFEALGMRVRNRSFQLAVMNNTEPSASTSPPSRRTSRRTGSSCWSTTARPPTRSPSG